MANDVVIRFIAQDSASATANKVATAITKVDSAGVGATKSTKSLLDNLSGYGLAAAGIIGVAVGFGKVAFAATSAYDKQENYRKSFQMLMGDVETGNRLFELVRKTAEQTPFETEDVTRYAQQLLSVGVAGDDIIPTIIALGDANFAMGGNTDTANRAFLAYTQILAKGKVTMEEVNQLTEAGIPVQAMMAKYYGITTQEMQKRLEIGLDSVQFLKDMKIAMDQQYGGAMEASLGTSTQAMSNFNDAVTHLQEEMGKQLAPVLTAGLVYFTGVVKDATVLTKELGRILPTLTMPTFGLSQEDLDALNRIWEGAGQGAKNYAGDVLEYVGIARDAFVDHSGEVSLAGDDLRAAYMKQHPELFKTAQATVPLAKGYKGVSAASNQLQQDEKSLKSAIDSLRTSFLNIADAQRAVTRTREALEDATNPDTLQSYQNAADRAYYSNQLLTNEMTRMGNRQRIVRDQLNKGNLSQEDRISLQNEDAQITEELIGKNIDLKDSSIALRKAQKDLDRARDPARIQEYADAHTTAMLRLGELDAKQKENINTLDDLNVKLGANVDVMGLVGEAAALTATPMDGLNLSGANVATTYGDVNTVLGTTSTSLSAIGQYSTNAITGVNGVSSALSNLGAVDPAKVAGISTFASSLTGLGSATSALGGIDFAAILGRVSSAAATLTGAVVGQWTNLGVSLNAVAAALAAINKEAASSGGGGGGSTPVTPEADVKSRIKEAFSDKFLSLGEFDALSTYASSKNISYNTVTDWIKDFLKTAGKEYTTYNEPVFGQIVGPKPIMGVDGSGPITGGSPAPQVINITLNYAAPPDSKNPLKDVEDYIAAQGGLIRI